MEKSNPIKDKAPRTYTLGPANPQKHTPVVAKLIADVFAEGKYVQEISETYIGNCHYDWETTRLIWARRKLLHHWGVWGYTMRLETAKLKVAGIGAVGTHPDYRKQGLMAQAAHDSFKAMFENGYDLSILRGRHYVKFGYARAWNYVTYRLKPEEIPAQERVASCHKIDTVQIPDMDSLYNRSHAGFSGTAIRPTYRNRSAEDMGVYTWFNSRGKMEGYVRALPSEDKKSLQCLEAVGEPQTALAVLADLFKQGGYPALEFFTLPHRHPILKMLRQRACIVETRYFDITGWRVRIINLGSTLEKLRPLLEKRLLHSHLAAWSGRLHLDAGEQRASLVIHTGQVQVAGGEPSPHGINAGPALARLLIGSDEPGEVIQQEGITCSGDALDLAGVLFPNLYPMLSHWDEF